MNSHLFIPTKIRAGFQARKDTYTQKLAYIIYYDNKGKIRKEKSWEGWRDETIDPVEFDNTPTDGFTLNKDVKRYSGEWFSSTRTLIRVYDPRGLEFEITTENLIGVLMHTDCLKRGLIGQFVYAWAGQELVLLPTNSEEYQGAVKYTSGLSKKVKAKELVPGLCYSTKREGNVVYLGKFDYHSYKNNWTATGPRACQKRFIFSKADKTDDFFPKDSVDFLAEPVNESPVSDYAARVEYFKGSFAANKIVKYELKPVSFDPSVKTDPNEFYKGREFLVQGRYFSKIGGAAKEIHIEKEYNYNSQKRSYIQDGYTASDGNYSLNLENGIIQVCESQRDSYQYLRHYRQNVKTLEQIQSLTLYHLYVTFECGVEVKIDSLNEFGTHKRLK